MVGKIGISGELNWETVEALAYAHCTSLYFSVLVPLIKSKSYDLAIEKDGVVKLVNVKIAGLKDRKQPDSWSISVAGGSLDTIYKTDKDRENYVSKILESKGKIDVFLVWLPHQNRFIELPGNFFSDYGSKSKRIPKKILRGKK